MANESDQTQTEGNEDTAKNENNAPINIDLSNVNHRIGLFVILGLLFFVIGTALLPLEGALLVFLPFGGITFYLGFMVRGLSVPTEPSEVTPEDRRDE